MIPTRTFSLAHAHGYLNISRNPLLRVHRDVPVISETIHEFETEPFSGPADSCNSVTDELDVDPSVSKTRKHRRLLHKSPVFARFSLDDSDEDDDTSAQTDCFMPAFAENSDEKRPVVGTVCSTVSGETQFLLPWSQPVNPTKSNLSDTSVLFSSSGKEVMMTSCLL